MCIRDRYWESIAALITEDTVVVKSAPYIEPTASGPCLLYTSVNNLVKKGYIQRMRSQEDRRVVLISLTEQGKKAYYHHKDLDVYKRQGF